MSAPTTPAEEGKRPMTPQEAIDCIKHNWPGDSNAFGRLREALKQAIAALKLSALSDYNLEWAKRLAAETAPLQAGGRHAGKVGTLGDDLALVAVQELIRRLDAELPPLPCGCPGNGTVCRAGSFEECQTVQRELRGPIIEEGDWLALPGNLYKVENDHVADWNEVETRKTIDEVRKPNGQVWKRTGPWWRRERTTK